MRVKAGARHSANRRGSEQSEKRRPLCSPIGPNVILVLARHDGTDHQRQTGPDEEERVYDSLPPEHMRNVMIANSPVVRLVEDALLPKNNRSDRQR
jgi:hypothetical protein